jgi:hypothetical protein
MPSIMQVIKQIITKYNFKIKNKRFVHGSFMHYADIDFWFWFYS